MRSTLVAHRAVGADAERERDGRDGGKPRAPEEAAGRLPEIVPQAVHDGGESEMRAATASRRTRLLLAEANLLCCPSAKGLVPETDVLRRPSTPC
jgi:hypothetical protein